MKVHILLNTNNLYFGVIEANNRTFISVSVRRTILLVIDDIIKSNIIDLKKANYLFQDLTKNYKKDSIYEFEFETYAEFENKYPEYCL